MCHAVPGKWCVFGCMLSAGGSFQWFRNQLGARRSRRRRRSRRSTPTNCSSTEAAEAPLGSEGLFFLPYLTGERCPHPDPNARGGWIGLTARTTRDMMIRSLLEGVTFGMRDALEIMKEMNIADHAGPRQRRRGAQRLLATTPGRHLQAADRPDQRHRRPRLRRRPPRRRRHRRLEKRRRSLPHVDQADPTGQTQQEACGAIPALL